MSQAIYLRFVLPRKHPASGVRDGIFGAAYELSNNGGLPEAQREEIDTMLRWFESNFDMPDRFNRTRSKGYYRRKTKGISWFKSTAHAHLEKARRLAGILKDNGFHITMIKTRNPGYIVHEDEHQIVAEPFGDTTA